MVKNMKTIIQERQGCSEERAALIEKRLKGLSEPLKPMLEAWLENGMEDDLTEYNGYSLKVLKEKYGMQFTGALLTLDWLIKEPDLAKKALSEGIR